MSVEVDRIFVYDEQFRKIREDISFTPTSLPPFLYDYMTRPLQEGRVCAYCTGEHFEDNMCFDCGANIESASVFVGLRMPDQEVYLIPG